MKLISLALLALLSILLSGCGQQVSSIGEKSATHTKAITPEEELVELTSKAEAGDKQAALDLYVRYFNMTKKADIEKAPQWLKVLSGNTSWLTDKATQGDRQAQFALAMTIHMSELSDSEKQKSIPLFNKAAEQGQVNAQLMLGVLYLQEKYGLRANEHKGFEWIERAALSGDRRAQYGLGNMYSSGKGVAKDQAKSVEWYLKAAEQGEVNAQYMLGDMYSSGKGVVKNLSKAVEWYSKSGDQGHDLSQLILGGMYSNGEGVPQDYSKAFGWYQRSAAQGNIASQISLSDAYRSGHGVNVNFVQAYAWMNLAATKGDSSSIFKKMRDDLAAMLTPQQRAEGQRLASNWKLGDIWLGDSRDSQVTGEGVISKRSTGTAFVVSKNGHALTNQHVVNGCVEMRLAGRTGKVKVLTADTVNDLALLEISDTFADVAVLNSEPSKLRQGEDVVVFGYPLNSVLSSGGNLTPGTVSALSGLGNNSNQIQITAPIQPGSSGSPVLDRKGYVVGVVSMKLDDMKAARVTGSIPQNVNFAINGQTVSGFLSANKVKYKTGGGYLSLEKNNADIAEDISKSTLLVECWR